MKHVLSIDGGGIRGLIPAVVLAEIENRTGEPTGNLFDMIVGTSTGGILGLGLTLPREDQSPGTSPQYSANELAGLYRERGSDIFQRSIVRKVTSGFNITDEKYPVDGLEDVLMEYFGNVPLGDAITDVVVSSYDLQNRKPHFFKSWQEEDKNVLMRDAARATSAAPSYFEPAQVTLQAGTRILVDGGIYINNPAVSAYAEARRQFGEEENLRLVAIGTGTSKEPIAYEDAKDWGLAQWGVRIYNLTSDGVSTAADYQLDYILGDRFARFQVPLREAREAMDDASAENLKALEKDAQTLIKSHEEQLSHVCRRLST
jgi:patatin-like phospholipase/acyl hydrolase